MGTLEEVENALDCLIIVVEKDGNMAWHSSTDLLHRKLGMIEFVRVCIKQDIAAMKGDA